MEAKTQFKDKNELVKALSELKEEPIFIGMFLFSRCICQVHT